MKKFLLSLICLISVIAINAETYTFNMSDVHGTATNSSLSEWTEGDFTFTPNKASGSTAPAFNKSGDVRIYAKNTFTITCATANMKSVSFTISSQGKKRMTTITSNNGEMTVTGASTYTCSWAGDANSVSFTVGEKATLGTDGSSKAGQLCFTEITIETGAVDQTAVAYPTITPTGGTYTIGQEVEVSIACATGDATITYSIDGGDAIEYVAPFIVTESCSIIATATNGTDTKSSEEAVFTFVEPVEFGYVTTVTSGKKYLIVAENESLQKTMTPLSGSFGYIQVVDVEPQEGYINMTSDVNAITITETEGGYTLQDSKGKYLYQTGTYNSFNVAADMPEEGAVWTIVPNNDGYGTVTITNTSVNKYIQYSTTHTSFGSYSDAQDGALLPRLYEEGATAMEDPMTSIEEIAIENAPVEYYNLQGVKVARPENGIFIKKQGSKATKVVL